MIQPDRIRPMNALPPREGGGYVLYWMQQSQRAVFNPALEYALERANALDLPLLVAFALTAYPDANLRAYAFLMEGLRDVAVHLARRGIGFVVRHGAWDPVILDLSKAAAVVVCDRGYVRVQREWRKALAGAVTCQAVQVEGDVVVPVQTASNKHEYAARTLRPKVMRLMDDYVVPLGPRPVHRRFHLDTAGDVPLGDLDAVAGRLELDRSVTPVSRFTGGHGEARERLHDFLDDGFGRYADGRNRPERQAASNLSPWLHFGHISPVEIALAVRAKGHSDNRAKFLEELVVRRELCMNHVLYEPAYDRFDSLPDWTRKALESAAADPRPHRYTASQFEAGETHDPVWNAAMLEMRATGYMHNYLRMYWGKKILEWSATPREAWDTISTLNNRYFLDGRDPASWTNIGWIFGLHDRPWGPRPVFGTVRSMGPNSLKKFDAPAYVEQVGVLAETEAG